MCPLRNFFFFILFISIFLNSNGIPSGGIPLNSISGGGIPIIQSPSNPYYCNPMRLNSGNFLILKFERRKKFYSSILLSAYIKKIHLNVFSV